MLQEFLIEMLKNDYGDISLILDGYNVKRNTTLRVNRLKSNINKIKLELDKLNINYSEPLSIPDSLILDGNYDKEIRNADIFKNGEIYLQSLSSQIPPIVLEPKENEDILDMAAAPGGKTCQIASMTNNKAKITAVEPNKIRADKLKFNLEKQNAFANVLVMDSRKLDDFFTFDNILLDAPCSGVGTILLNDEKTYKSISKELIINSSKLQLELLIKALKALKKGQTMVYSTCSLLKIENEDVLLKAMKKINFEIVKIDLNVPKLKSKLDNVITVLPTKDYEGFFVAKLKKL